MSTSKNEGLCEVCHMNCIKYTCPKCEVSTCSLPCVNIHKKELSCDGIRDKVKFIPLNSFKEKDLMNDYYFLENINKRTSRLKNTQPKNPHKFSNNLPVHLQKLKVSASKRGVNLKFLPRNFQRHQSNTTYLDWKTNELFWRIELVFCQAENVKWTLQRILETARISDVLQNVIDLDPGSDLLVSTFINKIQFYKSQGLNGIKVLLKAEGIEKAHSRFYELDITKTLQQNLKNKTIIEHPIIYLVMRDHVQMYDIESDEEDEIINTTNNKKPNEELNNDSKDQKKSHDYRFMKEKDALKNNYFNLDE